MNLTPGLLDAWTVWLVRRLPVRLVYWTMHRFFQEAGYSEDEAVKWMRRWPGTRQIIKGRT